MTGWRQLLLDARLPVPDGPYYDIRYIPEYCSWCSTTLFTLEASGVKVCPACDDLPPPEAP